MSLNIRIRETKSEKLITNSSQQLIDSYEKNVSKTSIKRFNKFIISWTRKLYSNGF